MGEAGERPVAGPRAAVRQSATAGAVDEPASAPCFLCGCPTGRRGSTHGRPVWWCDACGCGTHAEKSGASR